jgi:hypothetical protein
MIRFAAVVCSCTAWFTWPAEDREPPQAGCLIHGSLVFGKDGLVM